MKTAKRPIVNIMTMCCFIRSEKSISKKNSKIQIADLAWETYGWHFPCLFHRTTSPSTCSKHYQTVSSERPSSHDGQCAFHGSCFPCSILCSFYSFLYRHKHANTLRAGIACIFGLNCSIKVKFGDSVFIVGNVKTLYCSHFLYVLWQSRGQTSKVHV